jgi:hypothetical protein
MSRNAEIAAVVPSLTAKTIYREASLYGKIGSAESFSSTLLKMPICGCLFHIAINSSMTLIKLDTFHTVWECTYTISNHKGVDKP